MLDVKESGVRIAAMRERFGERYRRSARFREDGALSDELTREAEPVLEALFLSFVPCSGPRALHESYALLTLLGRRAALLGATPGAALAIVDAVRAGLCAVGVEVTAEVASELSLVVVEGYCAARDELVTRELREAAARSQVAVRLGPRCVAVYLAGRHLESDLWPQLERLARGLLHEDTKSCLLDVSRLEVQHDPDVARALGRFCALAGSLGVSTVISGADRALEEQFTRYRLSSETLCFSDDYDRAQALALATAGLQLKPRRRWARLLRSNRPGRPS